MENYYKTVFLIAVFTIGLRFWAKYKFGKTKLNWEYFKHGTDIGAVYSVFKFITVFLSGLPLLYYFFNWFYS